MPGYKTHLVGGCATYLIILQCIKSFQPTVFMLMQGFVFCLLGSLFPDVDIKSKGQNLFYVCAFMTLCCFLYYNRIDLFIGLSLAVFTPLLVKHRGIFHKIWFLMLLSLVMGIIIDSFHAKNSTWALKNALFFFAGALSHVVLDRVTTRLKYWFIRR